LVTTLASLRVWLYSRFQLSISRLADSQEIYSFRGVAPVELGASAPEAAVLPELLD